MKEQRWLEVPCREDISTAMDKWALAVAEKYSVDGIPKSKPVTHDKEIAAGEALREIRDRRLYRVTHRNFYLYCAERWGMTPESVNRLIEIGDSDGGVFSYDTVALIQPSQDKKESCVYFIAAGNVVKIGVTTDLPFRLRTIQLISPIPVRLVGYLSGNARREQEIHSLFADYRLHGEWFTFVDEIRKFIKQEAVETAPDGKVTAQHVQKTVDKKLGKTPKSSVTPLKVPETLPEPVVSESVETAALMVGPDLEVGGDTGEIIEEASEAIPIVNWRARAILLISKISDDHADEVVEFLSGLAKQ